MGAAKANVGAVTSVPELNTPDIDKGRLLIVQCRLGASERARGWRMTGGHADGEGEGKGEGLVR